MKQSPENDVAADLFDGLSDLEIMQKHNLHWAGDLITVFRQLVKLGLITQEELDTRFKFNQSGTPCREVASLGADTMTLDVREYHRRMPYGSAEIWDMSKGCKLNTELKNITEFGFMLAPIDVCKNEQRDFMIRSSYLEDVGAIEVLAECRWTNRRGAGFKIINASPASMRELRKFMELFTYDSLE